MSVKARLIVLFAALLLIPVFFTPIWSITLYAPQYPDGIGMHIWLDDVTGHERHDIRNINILNHYVGMAEIHPEDFWEFEVMPWVFAFMIFFGLLTAAFGKVWLLITWIGLFILLAIGGLVDFYYWGYQFGHDLDPRAPIKVPDMTYQPPLIGTSQLLNITAHSWPYWGSLFIGLSMIGAAFAYSYDRWLRPEGKKSTQKQEQETRNAA